MARLLAELVNSNVSRPLLRIDNKSAILLIKNPVHHDRSKHIDVRYHLIRDHVQKRLIEVEFVKTDEQLGDVLTKPLSKIKFLKLVVSTGLQNCK